MNPRIFLSTLLVLSAIALVSCERNEHADPSPADATSSQDPVTYGQGFDKAEVTPEGILRWARQESVLTITVADTGNYRLTFRPITVFSPIEAKIEVSVNDKARETIVAQGSDLAYAPSRSVEVGLQAGANKVTLKADRPDVRLSESDSRTAAIGLVLPVKVEKLP